MSVQRSGSIMAADIGSVTTRAVLLDLVDGEYRLVARSASRTTADFPFDDVSVGLLRAVMALGAVAGRTFVGPDNRIIQPEGGDRSGVDHFVATASVGRPLRALLVGLVPALSIASGLRAAAGTYITIADTLSLEDTRDEEARVNAIIAARPDLVLITGGTEGGAQEPVLMLARLVSLALSLLERPQRPVVLYAGNSELVPQMRTLFEHLTSIFVASNVRPSLEEEALDGAQRQLGRAFDEYKAGRGGGFDVVGDMSAVGVLPSAQSVNLIVEYLGAAGGAAHGPLAVDVGSATSTLSAYFNEQVDTVIRADLGLGHSAYTLLETVGIEAVAGWLPFYTTYDELAAYCRNKTLRPATIPESLKELYIEQALLRAAIHALALTARRRWKQSEDAALEEPLPPFNPLIGAGAALTATGSPGLTAMLLLDALQPIGQTLLQIDPHGLIPALGALADLRPEAVVQSLEGGGLETVGMAFCADGQPRAGRPALRVRITTSLGEVIDHTVHGGELWVYPLGLGQRVEVDVRVGRGVRIGGRRRVRQTIEGGTAGIIFDARGRPLPLGRTVTARAEQMPAWMAAATGDEVRPIDSRWLVPVDESALAMPERTEAPSADPRRAAAESPATAAVEAEVLDAEDRLRVLGARDKEDADLSFSGGRGTSRLGRLSAGRRPKAEGESDNVRDVLS